MPGFHLFRNQTEPEQGSKAGEVDKTEVFADHIIDYFSMERYRVCV